MRSKYLFKNLVYEEPFGFRVVHHMILTIFTSCICTFYNLTFKNTRNKTINNEIKENKTKIDYVMRLLRKI